MNTKASPGCNVTTSTPNSGGHGGLWPFGEDLKSGLGKSLQPGQSNDYSWVRSTDNWTATAASGNTCGNG